VRFCLVNGAARHIDTDLGGPTLGGPTLELLADGRTLAIIGALAHGPVRPGELERRLDGLPHAALMRRLSRLARHGVVSRERFPESPPRVHYALTPGGRALLAIPELAARWERGGDLPAGTPDPPASWALRQLADDRTRAVMMALADGPLRPGELERRLGGMGHSAVMRRLRRLALDGLLVRHPAPDGERQVRYELTTRARRLGVLVILAARWEARWEGPGGEAADASPVAPPELGGLLHVLAPLTRLPKGLAGVCQLSLDQDPPAQEPCIDLAAGAGGLATFPRPAAASEATVEGRATAEALCDALIAGRPTGITATGDRELLTAVIGGLHEALFAA
jgi:DNA-binding HxlR family transcriptional regulator